MPNISHTSHTADVVVIGGGIIGCAIALRLAQAGLGVLVFDRGEPGCEASRAAAGMLAPQGETVEPDAFYRLCAASRDLYPEFIAEVEQLSSQKTGYRREGTLLIATNEHETRHLNLLYDSQTQAGLPLERLAAEEVHHQIHGLSSNIRLGLYLPGDHLVDNERLSLAVAEAARRSGAIICAHRAVTKLTLRQNAVESIVTNDGRYSADRFVLAAGCWSGEFAASIGQILPLVPCRGQMLEFELPSELPQVVRAGPHYLVPRESRRVVLGTTVEYAGFDKAVTPAGMQQLLEAGLVLAPFLREARFLRAWAGLRPDTADHLPILGYGYLANLVFATGHFRNGILLAPLTAKVLTELVLGETPSHSIEAYHPNRFGA